MINLSARAENTDDDKKFLDVAASRKELTFIWLI